MIVTACDSQDYAPSHYCVSTWSRDRRERTQIAPRRRPFWERERVVLPRNRHVRPPLEDVRGAFDEKEESLRPRASLPVAFCALVRAASLVSREESLLNFL
jgi:hypothetical protein